MLEALGQAALRTLLLAAVVQLGLGLFRVERPQLRVLAWTIVLAASLAMPGLQWVTPVRLPILPTFPAEALTQPADPERLTPVPQGSPPASVEDVTAPAAVLPWLEALYLLVGGVLLLRLAAGVVLSLRLVVKAVPVRSDWAADTHVRISRDIVAPVTVANVILLPSDAVNWPPAMREAVLAHERAHIARRDFAMLLTSQINQAVFWFSPLSWWLHRRLATLAELATDDRAMDATGDRPGYAAVLLEMARRPGPLARGVAMARPATLKGRIERILSDRMPTTPASLVQQLVLAVGAASLSIMAASPRLEPVQPTDAVPSLASAPRAEEKQSRTLAELAAPALTEQAAPEPWPVRSLQAEIVPQAPSQPVPTARSAKPAGTPALRGAAQPTARQPTTSTPPPPPRGMVSRARSGPGPGAPNVPPKAEMVATAAVAPGNGGHGITNSPGDAAADGHTPPSHPAGQSAASETPLPRRADEPSCTGVYLPKPGPPHMDGSVDVVQALYFQEADGTPWLKLLLGVRNRAKLTGFEVERTSFRTTVLTTLPRGTDHVTGTTQGAYGAIDYECVRPHAHL